MINILISGSTGFIGSFFVRYFQSNYQFIKYFAQDNTKIDSDVVLHFAGKAHDIKNISTYQEYYNVNTELTKQIFDSFLASNAKVFITLSSVKAIADEVDGELTEKYHPNPITHYGKSKLLAEQYILSNEIPDGKRVYILRPCMIHGPGNKGNLNLLYSLVTLGIPWPLGSFTNSRSYLSIENLCFIIKELIDRENIPSGVYNVADDVPLSTNDLIRMIAESKGKKAKIMYINMSLIKLLARFGDYLKLPLNSERLQKLTDSYIVSNSKIIEAIGKPLPVSSIEGLKKTFQSFAENV